MAENKVPTKNKVFTKYMRPYYFGSGFFGLIVLGTSALAISNAKEQRNYTYTTQSIVNQSVKNYSLSILLVLLCLYMVHFSLVYVPKGIRENMKKIADKYADWAINKYPELSYLKTVKQDEKLLKEFCDFVCNSLSDQEIEKLVNLAKRYDTVLDSVSDREARAIDIKHIEQEVLTILQGHAMLNNGFMSNIAECIKNYKKSTTFALQNTKQRG